MFKGPLIYLLSMSSFLDMRRRWLLGKNRDALINNLKKIVMHRYFTLLLSLLSISFLPIFISVEKSEEQKYYFFSECKCVAVFVEVSQNQLHAVTSSCFQFFWYSKFLCSCNSASTNDNFVRLLLLQSNYPILYITLVWYTLAFCLHFFH